MGLWQVGADGSNWALNNFIILLCRQTKAYYIFVGNSTATQLRTKGGPEQ